ncbi:MAG TPA: MOSC domain-containing protein, partial [Thiotrichaceae bacterium]|nr:MOSC domain-containing protein [Thiotrichaceae bacterium]
MTAIISELFIYPLKSAAGIQLEQSPVDKSGLRYDRRWMLIDHNGDFLSQRQLPKMALIQPSLDTQGQLSLNAKNMPTIQVPLIEHSIATLPVVIWNTPLKAHHLSHEVDQWLSRFLNIDCQLVTLAKDTRRQCDLNYAQQGDHTTFTDGFPLLICTQASLDDLNSRLETKV